MKKIYNDSSLKTKMSMAGIEQARKFSWKAMAEDVLKIYNETLKAIA